MSQYFLRDTSIYPKTGFVFKDPDTNIVLTAGSFELLVKKASLHRKKNNLPVREDIVDMIHAYICAANKNHDGLCVQAEGLKGLGDVVHMFAQPIARVIDATFGTKIRTCGSCAKRREALNKAVPFRH